MEFQAFRFVPASNQNFLAHCTLLSLESKRLKNHGQQGRKHNSRISIDVNWKVEPVIHPPTSEIMSNDATLNNDVAVIAN